MSARVLRSPISGRVFLPAVGRASLVLVLLAALAAQALFAALATSATDDEPYYVVSGLSALLTGDYRLSVDHPPLMPMVCGAAAYLAGAAPIPRNQDWAAALRLKYSYFYLWTGANAPKAVRLVTAARLPVIALSLALALLVFVWARQLYGWRAALLPLVLYCFEPNIIAHSSVATLDLGLAAASSFALYAFWRFLGTRRWVYLVLTGIALGAAAAVKLPGLLLLVVLPVLASIRASADPRAAPGESSLEVARSGGWRTILPYFAAILGIALVSLWAVYRFGLGPLSLVPGAARMPLGQYWQAISFQVGHQQMGHPAYLLGQTSAAGWWYYYPLAFLVKTSLPLLILLGLAFSRSGAGLKPVLPRSELFLVVPAAIFLLFTMAQKLDLGIRYLLPIYPLLIILTGRTLAGRSKLLPNGAAGNRPRWMSAAVMALAVWAVAEALLYSPHYLAYFNELAGGPSHGTRVLVDSNLDWGQDLKRLAAWQRAHPTASPLHFAYFGPANVALYGVKCERLPDLGPKDPPRPPEWYFTETRPRPGWIAISVNCLKLIPAYGWLESYRPVDHAGYSIAIYHIPALSGPAQAGVGAPSPGR